MSDEWIRLGVTLLMAFGTLTGFIYRIKARGDLTSQRVDRLEKDLDRGSAKFDAVNAKLDDMSEMMSAVKEDVASMKTSVKYLENRDRNGRHDDA